MAKGKNQKLKLLYLLKILMEETDESHGLTRQELLDRLASHGVNADRKTLYTDFEDSAPSASTSCPNVMGMTGSTISAAGSLSWRN